MGGEQLEDGPQRGSDGLFRPPRKGVGSRKMTSKMLGYIIVIIDHI